MAKPLRLFIETPTEWTVAAPYGIEPGGGFSEALVLSSTTSTGKAIAAMAGRLSTRYPGEARPDPDTPIEVPEDSPIAGRVLLYLEPSFSDLIGRNNTLRELIRAEFSGLSFRYIVDATTLNAAIGARLDTVPIGANPRPTRDQLVRMFAAGLIDVSVTAGQEIGRAQRSAGDALLLFNIGSDEGSMDPSDFYDRARDFVEEGQNAVDQLLGVAPSVWPILGANRTQVMLETAAGIYPYSVLQEARRRLNLTRADWRLIGNNQKAIYRSRLLTRIGQAPAGSTVPPFEFNDIDWRNVFQLESVAEFFVNFREPWDGSVPLDPDTNVPKTPQQEPRPELRNLDVGRLDFLNFSGENATSNGANVVIGDAGIPFDRIRAHATRGDVIVLDADTGRQSHTFRITAKNAANSTLTLDAAPTLPAAGSTWTIKRRPQLVLIDPMGPRSTGTSATVASVDANGFATLQLDAAPQRVNRFFDNIYLPDDATPRRTYRILSVNGQQVTVQGSPNLAPSSRWQIQAGLGGNLDPANPAGNALPYVLGPLAAARGEDHFDGTMFVIYDERVRLRARWNSYTSRNNVARDLHSSIDGNRGYDIRGYRSSNAFRGYSLQVADFGQTDRAGYDTCTFARFFFDPLRRPPENPGGAALADAGGKTTIRIHYSQGQHRNHGCDSAGCVVSYHMPDLRTEWVEMFEEEYRALHAGAEEPQMARLRGATQARAQQLWQGNQVSTWTGSMAGTLWLVRPDQLPVGYNRPGGF